MSLPKIAYWVAIVIIFGSHIYMLAYGLPENQMTAHAVLNLCAGILVAYSYMKK